MPMMDFSVVVLPAPLRPSSVTTSPWCTSNDTPCKMCDSPYHACKSFTESSGARRSGMTRPHVGFLHLGIVGNRRVIALRQHAAARQYGDAMAKVLDHAQVVLDHEHGAGGGDALDQRGDPLDILVSHAGG